MVRNGAKSTIKKLARDYYSQGYAFAESISKAAADKGCMPKEYVKLSSAFARGMSPDACAERWPEQILATKESAR